MRHSPARTSWTAATALVLSAAWAGAQEEEQRKVPIDARKTLVERRTERLLGEGQEQEVRIALPVAPPEAPDARDIRKEAIEVRTESLLVAPTPAAPAAPAAAASENPKVAPGLVRWHADLAAAKAAARLSGKPVLVFQMLGNLDDEFC